VRAWLKIGLLLGVVALVAGLVVVFTPSEPVVHRMYFLIPPVIHPTGAHVHILKSSP
jgi:hypothetical protein